ncbi:MarR family winged helix-turn-helix transcriptional regulator [Thalassovita taeanensis]|nr:MarR family winged helix-turn-helix transcriptional regulator [Thalassovita taeanensis]
MPGHLVRRAHQVATAIFVEQMTKEGLDITPFQFAALSAIQMQPGLDQATAAAWTACDRATMGGVLDRLVEKGLVLRQISDKDRRARVLHLTDSGRAILQKAETVALAIQDSLTQGLNPQERDILVDLLQRVCDNHPK